MATIDTPRAIRVKTSTGWADLAIKGAPGSPGLPRFDYLGGWSAATTYLRGQIAVRNGVTFLCVRDTTTQPPASWPSVASVPTPVVNGQWLKGVGNAVAWAPLLQNDLPVNLATAESGIPSADYNNATASGWYVGVPTDANRPGDYYCHVQVFQMGGPQYLQIAHVYNAELSFIRRYTGSWGAWRMYAGGGDTAWTVMALGSGAAAYGAPYGPPRYRKTADNVVICDGLITISVVNGTVFTFPVGYRPSPQAGTRDLIFLCAQQAAPTTGYETFRINETGAMRLNNGNPTGQWISMAGVEFYAGAGT